MKSSILLILMTLFGICLISSQAHALRRVCGPISVAPGVPYKWISKVYTPVIDPLTIPFDTSVFSRYWAVGYALGQMNKNPSQFRFVSGGSDNNDGVSEDNTESEIYFLDLTEGGTYPPGAFIIAQEVNKSFDSLTCTARASDIQINTNYRKARIPVGSNKIEFSTIKNKLFDYGGSNENLTATLMHELGHTAGLEHVGNRMNLMGGDSYIVANANYVIPYVGESASDELIYIYGTSAIRRDDVSVSHWRWDISNGKPDSNGFFYSDQIRTKIYDAAGTTVLPTVCPYQDKPNPNGPLLTCPEPIYKVNKGQKINVEMSYESSTSTLSIANVVVRFYLSTDNNITTADIPFSAWASTFIRTSAPALIKRPVTIPLTAVSGQNYWLGAIVDPDNAIPELFEGNNATYIRILVN
jgi:hypothetical protein